MSPYQKIHTVPTGWRIEPIPMDETPVRFDRILARARVMKQVLQRLQTAALSDMPVLIQGETGTGKDLAAHSIHLRSKRRERPFLAVNMGSIPRDLLASELFGYEPGAFTGAMGRRPGKLALTEGGTLFLDEINALDGQSQAALLRAIENKEYFPVGGDLARKADVRIIAASNRDLMGEVKRGAFREDLYYRLEGFVLKLPALRERPGGVRLLAQEFLQEVAQAYGLDLKGFEPAALRLLEQYRWPGNVRELKNVVQSAALSARRGSIAASQLPSRISVQAEEPAGARLDFPLGKSLRELESSYLRLTLRHCGGNHSEAARVLGISRKALYAKLARAQKRSL